MMLRLLAGAVAAGLLSCAGGQVEVKTDIVPDCDPFYLVTVYEPGDPPITRVEIRCGDDYYILRGVEQKTPEPPL